MSFIERSLSALYRFDEEKGENEPFSDDELAALKEAVHLLTLRRCIAVACASATSLIIVNPQIPIDDFVFLQRQRVELDTGILMTQESLLDKLSAHMSQRGAAMTLFDIMDFDASGTIDIIELAESKFKLLHARFGSEFAYLWCT